MNPKKVFISYSHDSSEHAARVSGLAASLRRDGVDCQIDEYVQGTPPERWPLWMEKSIESAEFVLVVCTETYLRRVRNEEAPGKGLGATWEARLIYVHLYESKLFDAKFIPVIFDGEDWKFIPTPLRAASHYVLDEQKGYDRLYVTITGQHKPPPEIGEIKKVECQEAVPSFGEPGGAAVAAARASLQDPKLKTPSDPDYPPRPYPLLRPYTHPELYAGRERDLVELQQLLADTIPILGLYSTSGGGKSSLLDAGLSARLRNLGWPVAYTAYPKEQELVRRLLEEMLVWEGERTFIDGDPATFREAVRTAHALSGHPAILVLDQFEDVMDPSGDKARERIERLLTATVEEHPFCRWVLSYRHEYHGRVEEWLQDTFGRADLTWRGRFRTYPLKPLGADSREDSREAFLRAITAPLDIRDEVGKSRYGLWFCDGGAERLADAFAQARAEQPDAPLLPELQVVLAHLIEESETPEIQVPANLEGVICGALADHLRRAIEDVAEIPARRAEVLLVLRDLATDDGKRNDGRTVQEIEDALDETVLRKLVDEHRVLYRTPREGGEYCLLSHDRIAEAVVKEMENPRVQEWLDAELVALRRFVSSKAALLHHDPVEATSVSAETFRRISTHSKVLLSDKIRKEWWSACLRRNRERIANLGADLSGRSEAGRALELFGELSDLGLGQRELALLLEKRSDLQEVFEEGPARVLEKRRNAVVLAAAASCTEFMQGRLRKGLDYCATEAGALLWALDYGPMRDQDSEIVTQARRIRQLLSDFLRELHPSLPQLTEADWALIPGGTFQMGSESQDAFGDERPVHTVTLTSFRMLKHQVTNSEFGALFGDVWEEEAQSKPLHPAVNVTWYQACIFAAWMGGRLPTEAEWEYAARSGGKDLTFAWGDLSRDIHERAVVSSFWRSPFRSGPLPVGSKPKGNTDHGVCDMAGNVWEWVADWYRNYSGEAQKDPWGPPPSGGRVIRGGCFSNPAVMARASCRCGWSPIDRNKNRGFRLVATLPDQT